jgi:hypothetical protein
VPLKNNASVWLYATGVGGELPPHGKHSASEQAITRLAPEKKFAAQAYTFRSRTSALA